jgi:hypothetical protein
VLDGQGREEAANLLVAELGGGPTADESLIAANPKAKGFEGAVGVIA